MHQSASRRIVFVYGVGVALAIFQGSCSVNGRKSPGTLASRSTVGRVAENRYGTPTGQVLTPFGKQVELPGIRPQALALSPNGKLLATSGKTNLLILIDAATGQILQRISLSTNKAEARAEAKAAAAEDQTATPETPVSTPSGPRGSRTNAPSSKSQLSFTGLTFSPDGRHLYLSTPNGTLRVFPVDPAQMAGTPTLLPVPDAKAPKQRREIPAGLAVSADGRRLYVVGNLGNKLHELEAETGKALRSWETGVAPYDVVLVGDRAYVSNQGGRRPGTNDLSAPAGKGMRVRVDPVRHIASEGSVTVINLATGSVRDEVLVGLHASALAVSPNQRYVVVANTGSDTLSVIDTKTDQVVE